MRSNKCSIAIYIYASMRRNTTQHIFLSYVYLCVSFLNMYILCHFSLFPFFSFHNLKYYLPFLGNQGEPPPDVVSGENVTLPSSFIALRREAINSCLDQPTPGAPTSLSSHARCSKRIRAGREGWSAKSCLLRELPSCKFVS